MDRTVYVSGVPYEAIEDDIIGFFESCGEPESVRMPRY